MRFAIPGGRVAALAATTLAIVLGPAAAQALAGSYYYTVHIHGSGTVTGPSKFSCASTELAEGTEGATCTLRLDFPIWPAEATYYLSASPGTTPSDNWRFADVDDDLADGGWAGCNDRRSDHQHECRMWLAGTLDPTKNVYRDVHAYFDDHRGPSAAIEGGPQGTVTSGAAAFTVRSADADAVELWCAVDGGAERRCATGNAGSDAHEVGNGAHTFAVRGKDASGNWGAPVERTWTVDLPPETTLAAAGPAEGSLGAGAGATFAFSSPSTDVGPGGFDCRLDGPGAHDWRPCTSPVAYTGLPDGAHTFSVRARDVTSADATAATRRWSTDTAAPETEITSGPTEGAVLSLPTVAFGFRTGLGEPPTTTFACSVDGGRFQPCPAAGVQLGGFGLGDHRFAVRARDAAGNLDATPAVRRWRVVAVDADGDGVTPPADCDDAAPGTHPGAPDVPGNGVDEDCDRADATFPRLTASLAWTARVSRRITRFRKLEIGPVPAGARIEVTCKGRGCPAPGAVLTGTGTVRLKPYLKARLRPGARLEVRVVKDGWIGVVKRIRVLRGKDPRVASRCLFPGDAAPRGC